MLTIVDWNERYEKSDTRKCKDMKWVPVPNRWDSIGYLAIMDLPDALAVMGAWMLILEVASRCEHRGILAEAGQPLTPAMIAAKVRAPLKGINRAIDVLSSPAISWISNSIESHPDDIPASREIIPGTREIIPTTGQDRTGQDRTKQDSSPRSAVEPLPFLGDVFRSAWESWLSHRRGMKKKPYTPEGIVAQFKRLASWGEDRAVAAIYFSIAQNWEGIYEEHPRSGGSSAGQPRRASQAVTVGGPGSTLEGVLKMVEEG